MKKMIILFLLAAMLLMLAGCGGAPAQQPAVPETTEVPTEEVSAGVDYASFANKVNVLCYNIYYQDVEARQENIQDLILKNDPDVLLLQEVSYDWIPYIKSFMEENNYSYYGYGRHGGELLADDVATGDQFIASRDVKDSIIENFAASCTEMEGGAIAQAAFLNKIPFVIIRAISDKADNSAQMDYPEFERQAVEHTVRLLDGMLKQL